MKGTGLLLLYVQGSAGGNPEVLHALRERGHRLHLARSESEVWTRPEAERQPWDGALCDVRLGFGSAFELCRNLRRAWPTLPIVLLDAFPTLDACRAALRAGAVDYLAAPVNPRELLAALESGGPSAAGATAAGRLAAHFDRDIVCGPDRADDVATAVAELLGFLLARGFSPAVRARAGGAAFELLQNVSDHAYRGDTGPARIRAQCSQAALALQVLDAGCGMSASKLRQAREHGTGGLARASALVERLVAEPEPGRGLAIELHIDARSAAWDREGLGDWSEHDCLRPSDARMLIDLVRSRPQAAIVDLPPALSVVLGRLLAGTAGRRPHPDYAEVGR
jgi:CheY-like chemotaxis protein/anti-sigma regulatory factor (Ser/Thr protein kinase)